MKNEAKWKKYQKKIATKANRREEEREDSERKQECHEKECEGKERKDFKR